MGSTIIAVTVLAIIVIAIVVSRIMENIDRRKAMRMSEREVFDRMLDARARGEYRKEEFYADVLDRKRAIEELEYRKKQEQNDE